MGYTNYYSLKQVSQEEWDKFIADVKTVYKNLPDRANYVGEAGDDVLFLNGDGRYKLPHFGKAHIWFNGGSIAASKRKKGKNGYWEADNLSHETFVLRRKGCDEFCKTARKPYDVMVKTIFILMEYHFPGKCKASWDGDTKDMRPAIELIISVLGSEYVIDKLLK